jgi:hypothetical protein
MCLYYISAYILSCHPFHWNDTFQKDVPNMVVIATKFLLCNHIWFTYASKTDRPVKY